MTRREIVHTNKEHLTPHASLGGCRLNYTL
jgi:hypothetical protein